MRCKYPGCSRPAYKTWALVDLCKTHYQDIVQETFRYYHGKGPVFLADNGRKHFYSICHLIPWTRKRWL